MTAYVTTAAEAEERTSEIRGRSSPSSGVIGIARIVVPTGSPSVDDAAVDAKIDEIQDLLDPGEEEASMLDHPIQELENFAQSRLGRALSIVPALSAAILAAKCKNGQPVGTHRRADFRINVPSAGTRVQGQILYKRISCARWKITAVEMMPNHEPTIYLWFRDFFYTRAWLGNGYEFKQAGAQCEGYQLHRESLTVFRPAWEIQARGRAEVELIDANPITPGIIPSCYGGAGTSYKVTKSQAGFRLPGGTK